MKGHLGMETFITIIKNRRVLIGLIIATLAYYIIKMYCTEGGSFAHAFWSGLDEGILHFIASCLGLFIMIAMNTLLWALLYGFVVFSLLFQVPYNVLKPDNKITISSYGRLSIGIIMGIPIDIIYHIIKGDWFAP